MNAQMSTEHVLGVPLELARELMDAGLKALSTLRPDRSRALTPAALEEGVTAALLALGKKPLHKFRIALHGSAEPRHMRRYTDRLVLRVQPTLGITAAIERVECDRQSLISVVYWTRAGKPGTRINVEVRK